MERGSETLDADDQHNQKRHAARAARLHAGRRTHSETNSEFEREDADEDGFDDANDMVEISPDDRQNAFVVKSEMELMEELRQKESRRDRGYKIALAAAKESGDAMLLKYVEVMFSGLPTDRAVSKKLKKTLAELQELQDQLLAIIRKQLSVEKYKN